MSSAKITLMGFYKWYEDRKTLGCTESLFDNLAMPQDIDESIVVANILDRGGEFEVLYADPDYTRAKIATWSAKWMHTFERWYKALSMDYEPLYNYDRTETETRTPDLTETASRNKEESHNYSESETRTPNLTTTRTANLQDTNSGTITTEHTVSAFDSSSYQPSEKDVQTPANTVRTTGTDTNTVAGTESYTRSHNEEAGEGETGSTRHTGTEKWERRAFGNIGVTTSQQMLEAELNISAWNLYDHITDVFLREFTIPVYD